MKKQTAITALQKIQTIEGIDLSEVITAIEEGHPFQANNILNGICQHEAKHLPALEEFRLRFNHAVASQ